MEKDSRHHEQRVPRPVLAVAAGSLCRGAVDARSGGEAVTALDPRPFSGDGFGLDKFLP